MQDTPFSIAVALLIFTVVVSIVGFQNDEIQRRMMLNPYETMRKKQFHRLLTSGFVHGGWMHLGFNMLTFFFFAPVVEETFLMHFRSSGFGLAFAAFIGVYLGGIIISDIPTLMKFKDQPNYNSLGASGGVSAVVFASILFNPVSNICLYGILCLPGFILGIIYVGYSYYMDKKAESNINHSAHLYGALYGIAFCLLIRPKWFSEFLFQIQGWIGSF